MELLVPEVVWKLEAELGEGPVWLADEARLLFVDIKLGHVHAFNPATGEGETLVTGGNPSFVLPASDGSLLVGSRQAIHRLEDDRLGQVIATIPEPASNRTNDATVDATGRLWFGTMDDGESEPSGAIWCLNTNGLHPAGPRAVVTNGPAVSLGDHWLYHVDSGGGLIWRHPLGAGPVLNEGEVFVRIAQSDGYPDGIVVDSEECLWVALWDGACVRRYSPQGELLLQVDFPCSRVTKLAFGGPQLKTAYVTTARTGLPADVLAEQPLAGSLFAFPAPAAGLPGQHIARFSV